MLVLLFILAILLLWRDAAYRSVLSKALCCPACDGARPPPCATSSRRN